MKLKLEIHFGEDVILTGIQGKRNVVISRSIAKKILERFLKSAKKKLKKMKLTNSNKGTAC